MLILRILLISSRCLIFQTVGPLFNSLLKVDNGDRFRKIDYIRRISFRFSTYLS
jgi:hypothetical protein